jgi:chromosomal replication initiation ATPase DnaA
MNPTTVKITVAEHFGITLSDINGPSKARHIAEPRQFAMQIVYDKLGLSYPKTAAVFNRGQTTVHYAVTNVRARIQTYPADRANHQQITAKLGL